MFGHWDWCEMSGVNGMWRPVLGSFVSRFLKCLVRAGLWLTLVQREKTWINKSVSWFGLGSKWNICAYYLMHFKNVGRLAKIGCKFFWWVAEEWSPTKSTYKFISTDLSNSLCRMCIYLNVGLMPACQMVYSCPVQVHLLLFSLVEFHPDISRLQLFSSSIDYKIRIWDLNSSKCVAMLDGHFSAVTSLAFADGNTLIR